MLEYLLSFSSLCFLLLQQLIELMFSSASLLDELQHFRISLQFGPLAFLVLPFLTQLFSQLGYPASTMIGLVGDVGGRGLIYLTNFRLDVLLTRQQLSVLLLELLEHLSVVTDDWLVLKL